MEWINAALDALGRGWVGSIIGLVGIVAAIATYLLTRQRTLLVYRYAGDRLLGLRDGGLPPDITVQFRGHDIPRLTRTLLVLWNAGERTIVASDLVQSDPLRIELGDDATVLAVTTLKMSRDVIDFRCELNAAKPNEVRVAFAFLDSGDGAVVEILHTSEARQAELAGTVRGLPKGIRNLGRIVGRRSMSGAVTRLIPKLLAPRAFGWTVVAVGIAFTLAALFLPDIPRATEPRPESRLLIASAGVLYAALGLAMLWLARRRYPRSLHVDELD